MIVTDDPVYMEDPEWRDEYVLNDTGKVYTGNYKQVGSRNTAYPTGRKFPLELKFRYFANSKFAKSKFCILLHF